MENKEKVKFLKEMEELYDFTEKEFDTCVWVNELSVERIIEELEEEVEEIKEEIKKGNKDELAKETADAFRDMFLLLYIVSRKTGISKDRILAYILKKVRWRKPWVERGEKISMEEAKRIWDEKKANEKIEI